MKDLIKWFHEVSLSDLPLVGGKNASLGEMYRELTGQGVQIPNGFAITADAYWYFLEKSDLKPKIAEILQGLDHRNLEDLQARGSKIRQVILSGKLPLDLEKQILDSYDRLSREGGVPFIDVAVRSSATAEDLPGASFAGQQETYLNVQGHALLLDACKRCFASLFTDRAISYREDMGFDHLKVGLSIGIQRMVRSDLAASGVMFSIDTETGFKNAVVINASYGLGENIVQGAVNPDEYYVFKPTLGEGRRPILQRKLGTKEFRLIYDTGGAKLVKNVPVSLEDRERYAISDDDVLTLARWAVMIEDYYSKVHGRFTPMDMEWAKDGRTGQIFIVQARPETVQSRRNVDVLETYSLKEKAQAALLTGRSVGEKIAQGKVRVVRSVAEIERVQPGDILVTEKTDPDWEPMMKKTAAIITNRGGRTCHAAIVARELGVPAIVGTERGTELLRDGMEVTVCCAEGETGAVYSGLIPFEKKTISLQNLDRPKTKIMMNVGNPDESFRLSMIPNDGVGLAREEFIISNSVLVHPLALIHWNELKDLRAKDKIGELTKSYPDKPSYFVEKLAEGVGTIGAAFYPKDVIVRLSDFKTNEYANLLGGKEFEPDEENPMLGFRGASRYYDPRYRDGFALECRAMKRVRDEMGLTNVKLMVPFCRTLGEAKKVIDELEKNGLRRGENGLEVYVMCEIPSNVISADRFAEFFDGFSIGSNDLTQLTLGVDRDSEIVAHVFDERDPAVKELISTVIRRAKAAGRKIGICGQAPSDYPEFAEFLVKEGIDSISLNPDVVLKTTLAILKSERR
ncbi:MAG: phosphoenolpyruvate synthase [Oligoflexia bacterium]|nr:phosphoenolpyruvate synthase [Oligoflexia bacterium]